MLKQSIPSQIHQMKHAIKMASFLLLKIYLKKPQVHSALNLRSVCRTSKNFALPLQVVYEADSVRLDLLSLAQAGSGLLTTAGNIDFLCKDVSASSPLAFRAGHTGSPGQYMVSTQFPMKYCNLNPL